MECVNSWKNAFNQSISTTDCPLECTYVVYSTNLNSAAYPTSYYTKILQQNQNVINRFNGLSSFNPSILPTQQVDSILSSTTSPSKGTKNQSNSGN